jgi:hypothetical protein
LQQEELETTKSKLKVITFSATWKALEAVTFYKLETLAVPRYPV